MLFFSLLGCLFGCWVFVFGSCFVFGCAVGFVLGGSFWFFFALALVLVASAGVLLVVVEWLFGSFLLLFGAAGVSDCVSFLFGGAFVWFFCIGVFWHCVLGLGVVWGFSLFVFVSFMWYFLCFLSSFWRV